MGRELREVSHVQLVMFSSAFCEPCMQTRSVLEEAARLIPGATFTDLDIVAHVGDAETAGIQVTPTVLIRNAAGDEVFRAQGAPSLNQVLVAAAKAL
jgi:hypothetical protein